MRNHILREQDGILSAALAQLSAEDWESVEAIRAQVGTALPTPPPTSSFPEALI
ncbi:hypothetical protein ACFYST_21050 [Kitasatospora sp. NPDC004614]|uniref:hypothetical protein n=1 Tax=unclassified Kitasatospora TaxID=2633591 RepID=UPI0036AE7366